MKNLVFQYYIPYESFDADMGGIRLPEWAHAGSRSAKAYADYCGAEYELSHDRFFDQIDPRLDSIKIVFDKKYDEYDYILSIDLDMLIHSGVGENIFEKEQKTRSSSELSQNVAKYLFKLMATKDEYEVARLSLKAELDSAISQEFGKSAKINYMLHPPFLKAMENIPILNMLPGVKSKLALGSWFKVFYVMLKNMKFLRGTPFDFMAWFSSDVRKADKKALNHYKSILEKNINEIGNGKYQDLKEFSSLPDIIRGYEEVRLDTMTEYYKKSDNLFKA